MDKLQLVVFFGVGFLVSRVIISAALPERIVRRLVGRGDPGLTRVVLYLLALAALLSFFIPNAVTVLTLLPILERVRTAFCRSEDEGERRALSTVLALTVIYGANIGGLGSITGTPANGLLVVWIETHRTAGREAVQYVTWLAWGVPLVLTLTLAAWGVISVTLRTWRWPKAARPADEDAASLPPIFAGRSGWALIATGVFFVSSTALSLAMLRARGHVVEVLGLSAGLGLVLALVFFWLPVGKGRERRPLLTLRECGSDLPLRGFALVGVAVVLGAGLFLLDAHEHFARWASAGLPPGLGLYAFLLLLALLTSFSTEVLSNTAVQLALFLMLGPLADNVGHPPLSALTVVTLSCTCAFMSPIATGVNGLAVGGLRGVSLGRMVAVGLLMNTVAAPIIAVWVRFFVPW